MATRKELFKFYSSFRQLSGWGWLIEKKPQHVYCMHSEYAWIMSYYDEVHVKKVVYSSKLK